ncbi:MAG: DUF4440 domain-containing protein, partial [Planctomycetota bacterium]
MVSVRSYWCSMAVGLVVVLAAASGRGDTVANATVDELKKASAAYAEAFNKRDYAALADQWTANAELVEGGTRLAGRATIVDSLKLWRERCPEATLAIELREVDLVAEPIARVAGVMRFTKKPGVKPTEST